MRLATHREVVNIIIVIDRENLKENFQANACIIFNNINQNANSWGKNYD